MGFTGDKAAKFKEDFIGAFNEMENRLTVPSQKQLPQTYVAALRELANEVELRELAENKVFELEPKAEVFDRIANADNLLAMNSAAKSLGTTRPKLFKLLRDRSILMGNNLPYQRYIDSGMFKVKVKPIEMGHSGSIDYPQTFVTAKGLTWLGKGIVKLEKEKA
jgi:anti-repressor protein